MPVTLGTRWSYPRLYWYGYHCKIKSLQSCRIVVTTEPDHSEVLSLLTFSHRFAPLVVVLTLAARASATNCTGHSDCASGEYCAVASGNATCTTCVFCTFFQDSVTGNCDVCTTVSTGATGPTGATVVTTGGPQLTTGVATTAGPPPCSTFNDSNCPAT